MTAIFVAALIGLAAQAEAKVRVGDRAPEFVSVVDGAGKRAALKKHRGKVVVLTFGASWCKPCAKELPAYEKAAAKLAGRDVVFIAVNIDNSVAKGKAFVRKAGLKVVMAVFDPRKTSVESWDPPTMPSTFIIDRKGLVRHLHRGYEKGDEASVVKMVNKLLK